MIFWFEFTLTHIGYQEDDRTVLGMFGSRSLALAVLLASSFATFGSPPSAAKSEVPAGFRKRSIGVSLPKAGYAGTSLLPSSMYSKEPPDRRSLITVLHEASDAQWEATKLQELISRAQELGDKQVFLAAINRLAVDMSADPTKLDEARYLLQYCIANLDLDCAQSIRANCYMNLGRVEFKSGRFGSAYAQFNNAVNLFPEKSSYRGNAAFEAGVALAAQKKWNDARRQFALASTILSAHKYFAHDLEHNASIFNEAVCAARMNDLDAAGDLLRQMDLLDAEEFFPTFDVRVLSLKARIYYMQDRFEKSEEALIAALKQLDLSVPATGQSVQPDLLSVESVNQRKSAISAGTRLSLWGSRLIDPDFLIFSADIAGSKFMARVDPSATAVAADEPIAPANFPNIERYPQLPVKEFPWTDVPRAFEQEAQPTSAVPIKIASHGVSDFVTDRQLIAQDGFETSAAIPDQFTSGSAIDAKAAPFVVQLLTREQYIERLFAFSPNMTPPPVLIMLDRFTEPEAIMRLLVQVQRKAGKTDVAARTEQYANWRFLNNETTDSARLIADIDPSLPPSNQLAANTLVYGPTASADSTSANERPEPTLKLLVAVANQALLIGDLDTAQNNLEKAIKQKPDDENISSRLAQTYTLRGNRLQEPTEAMRWYYKALLLNRYADAIEGLEKSIASLGLDSSDPQVRNSLAEKSLAEGDLAGAEIQYRASLELRDDAKVKDKLAKVLISANKAKQIPNLFQDDSVLSPDVRAAVIAEFIEAGDWTNARKILRDSLSNDWQNYNLLSVRFLAVSREMAKNKPSADSFLNLSEAAAIAGLYDEARAAARVAALLAPQDRRPQAMLNSLSDPLRTQTLAYKHGIVGAEYFDQKLYREAIHELSEAIASSPADSPNASAFHLMRGLAFKNLGEQQSAAADLAKVKEPLSALVSKYDKNLSAEQEVTRQAVSLGDYPKASEAYEAMLKQASNSSTLLHDLGSSYLWQARYADALNAFEREMATGHYDPRAVFFIAAIREHQGNIDEALKNYRAFNRPDAPQDLLQERAAARIAALEKPGAKGEKLPSPGDLQRMIKAQKAYAKARIQDEHYPEKALVSIKEAVKFQPKTTFYQYFLGTVLTDINPKESIAVLRPLSDLNPDYKSALDVATEVEAAARSNLAMELANEAQQKLQDSTPELAISAANRALKIDPECTYAYIVKTRAYLTKANAAKAQEALAIAEKLSPDDSELPDLRKEIENCKANPAEYEFPNYSGGACAAGCPPRGKVLQPENVPGTWLTLLSEHAMPDVRSSSLSEESLASIETPLALLDEARGAELLSMPGQPKVSASADVDFGPYMADLQRRIKKNWYPPGDSRRVVVIFKVAADGKVSDLRIEKSSGNHDCDSSAIGAVESASPLRPLPAGAPSVVDIQFTFDYTISGGSGTLVGSQQIHQSWQPLANRPNEEARTLNNDAVLLGSSNRWDEAIQKHREAVGLDPGIKEFRTNLSAAYLQHGKYLKSNLLFSEAINKFRMAMLVDPANHTAQVGLTECLQKLGVNTEDHDATLRASQRAFDAGDYVTAFTELLRQGPSTGSELRQLASLYARMGCTVEAYRLSALALREGWRTDDNSDLEKIHTTIGDINRQYVQAATDSNNSQLAQTRLFNSAVAYRRAATLRPDSRNDAQRLEQQLQAVIRITPSKENTASLSAAQQLLRSGSWSTSVPSRSRF